MKKGLSCHKKGTKSEKSYNKSILRVNYLLWMQYQ